MTTENVHQLLIDAFSAYGKLLQEGKRWTFQSAELGRLYVTVLYGLKNNNIKDADIEALKSSLDRATKAWQESK